MKIYLSPVRMDCEPLRAFVDGDTITVNDIVYNLSGFYDGAVLPWDTERDWFTGDIKKVNGEIELTLILPHGANAPHETRFPEAFTTPIQINYGEVPLPPYGA